MPKVDQCRHRAALKDGNVLGVIASSGDALWGTMRKLSRMFNHSEKVAYSDYASHLSNKAFLGPTPSKNMLCNGHLAPLSSECLLSLHKLIGEGRIKDCGMHSARIVP